MDRFNKITAPAGDKLRQLQKIVNEISSNHGGIMQRFKNRITSKPPPSVPRRDYVREPQEDEVTDNWSDEFDYDDPEDQSDQEAYVYPDEQDEQDQNYEAPPNDHEPKFPTSYRNNDSSSGYIGKDHRQLPNISNGHTARPNRPLPKLEPTPKSPQSAQPPPGRIQNKQSPRPVTKPVVMPRQPPFMKQPMSIPQQDQDEEEYILPDEDDNYIEPTQSPPPTRAPKVDRAIKPSKPPKSSHFIEQDNYDVPDTEIKPSPPVRKAPPRRSSPPKQEPQEDYEVCDDFVTRPDPPTKPAPSPHPRNVKPRQLPVRQNTPVLLPRDVNSNMEPPPPVERPERLRLDSPSVPPTNFRLNQPPKPIQKPPENRHVVNPRRHGSIVEQDAGVIDKEWYTSSCDRKAAEEALQASNKDGSFLVRRSTGHNTEQPFTLVVFYNRKVYNIPVRYIASTRKYALGREKSGEEKFNSVAEMIENHQRTQLVLIDSQSNTKDFTKLRHAVQVP